MGEVVCPDGSQGGYMHATRVCRTLSLSCRSPPLAARHLEHRLFRLPTLTSNSSRRNLSTSTTPRRAQYSRFDDDPNRPPPPSLEIQKRDIIIYTLGAGSIVYYIFQCVLCYTSLVSPVPLHLLLMPASKKSRASPRDRSMALHGCQPKI
jgi:hypothetical protein